MDVLDFNITLDELMKIYNSNDLNDIDKCLDNKLEAVGNEVKLFLIVLYTVTSIISFVGNITVVIVELFGTQTSNRLRKFIINMAISDIIMSVLCVPFTYTNVMLGHWIFQAWMCPATQFTQLLSVFVTSYTLTIIGIERYLATVHPFSQTFHWIRNHTNLLLYFSWILGIIYSSLWFTNTRTAPFDIHDNIYYECRYGEGWDNWTKKFLLGFNFVCTYALPLIVITFSYAAITRRVLEDSLTSDAAPMRRNTVIRTKARTIKMMFAVVLLYAICWTPIKLYQMAVDFIPSLFTNCSDTHFNTIIGLYFFAHWLSMSNSCVNPIVYSFMSKKFRDDFKGMYTKRRTQRMSYRNDTQNTRV